MKGALSRAAGLASVEALAAHDTVIHRLHPVAKLLVTLGFIIAVISLDNRHLGPLLAFFAYPLLLSAIGEVPMGWVLRRALPGLPFVLFAGISNVIFDTAPGLTFWGVGVSSGVLSCMGLCLKALLALSSVALLCATTPLGKLLNSLRALHVPKVFITVCLLCFRYLSLLGEQAARMGAAYRLRSGKKALKMRHMGSFLGQLVLLSADRAERVYGAMELRGYTGDFPLSSKQPFDLASGLYVGLLLSGFILLRMGGTLL